MKQHRVVVGVDGSATARRALAWALEEARLRSAELEVVMTWEMPVMTPYGGFTPPFAELEAAATATIEEMVQSVTAAAGTAGVAVLPSVVMAQPAGALIDASKGADLLVVGSRGWSTFTGLVLGSVSQQCVTHAECPVAVIPPAVKDGGPLDDAVVLMPAGQVVVGVDGSPGSEAALRWAVDDARRRNASVVAVLSYSHLAQSRAEEVVALAADIDEAAAQSALDELLAAVVVDVSGVKIRGEVAFEHPAVALHQRCGPDDVLVVGARGFGGFKGLLLGSVSLQTLRHAPGPVVVVRPYDEAIEER